MSTADIGAAAVSAPPDKRLATAQARCALSGIVLHAIEADDGSPLFIATRWSLTKSFTDLGDVERWLDRVDGRRQP